MATYVITVPDEDAPETYAVLVALASGIYGEDVRSHCMANFTPRTGTCVDEATSHHRLGLTVRRVL